MAAAKDVVLSSGFFYGSKGGGPKGLRPDSSTAVPFDPAVLQAEADAIKADPRFANDPAAIMLIDAKVAEINARAANIRRKGGTVNAAPPVFPTAEKLFGLDDDEGEES